MEVKKKGRKIGETGERQRNERMSESERKRERESEQSTAMYFIENLLQCSVVDDDDVVVVVVVGVYV